jgi:putative flavoprotein involved in K+ transport
MAQAIVCGAGPAGLAAAACLKRAGFETEVLERGGNIGESWRRRYPALRLNTVGWMSTLPGYRAKRRRYGEYPTRDSWIGYLEDYARHHGIKPEFGVEVRRVDRLDGGWRVHTSEGERESPVLVVAMGFDHDPHIPDWPGRDSFQGELIHAADYHDPAPYRDRDVLIVGPGNTGSEIAAFLADGGAERVRAAMRTPPNVFPRKWLGTPVNYTALLIDVLPDKLADSVGRVSQRMIYGDLSKHGLPYPPLGVKSNLNQRLQGPAVDAGFVDALKEGRIELLPTVSAFEGRDVVLADGQHVQPDVVICATGYRRGLADVVGHLDVLDELGLPRGWPTVQVERAPNLFFVGYYSKVSGQIRQMRFEARRVARIAKRQLAARLASSIPLGPPRAAGGVAPGGPIA